MYRNGVSLKLTVYREGRETLGRGHPVPAGRRRAQELTGRVSQRRRGQAVSTPAPEPHVYGEASPGLGGPPHAGGLPSTLAASQGCVLEMVPAAATTSQGALQGPGRRCGPLATRVCPGSAPQLPLKDTPPQHVIGSSGLTGPLAH